MESIDEKCTPLKEVYDRCFNNWYSEKFLHGDASGDECGELFKSYKECLDTALTKHGYDIESLEANVFQKSDPELQHLDMPEDQSRIVQREAATMASMASSKEQDEKKPA